MTLCPQLCAPDTANLLSRPSQLMHNSCVATNEYRILHHGPDLGAVNKDHKTSSCTRIPETAELSITTKKRSTAAARVVFVTSPSHSEPRPRPLSASWCLSASKQPTTGNKTRLPSPPVTSAQGAWQTKPPLRQRDSCSCGRFNAKLILNPACCQLH